VLNFETENKMKIFVIASKLSTMLFSQRNKKISALIYIKQLLPSPETHNNN